ncbi:MAG: hypothetical protein ACI4Q9_02565 [Candidatus Methanomethylophilaceae archaeon]
MGAYTLTVLCGGKSLMLVPRSPMDLDPSVHVKGLGAEVMRASPEMAEFMYRDVKITLYSNGGLMFYHLSDADVAETYADEILSGAP